MIVIKFDLLDGSPVEIVAPDEIAAARLRKFSIDAGDAFSDRERWEKMRKLMTHEHSGPHVGWTLGMVLPGDDPDDAIDRAGT